MPSAGPGIHLWACEFGRRSAKQVDPQIAPRQGFQRTDHVTRRHTVAGVVQGLAPCSRSVQRPRIGYSCLRDTLCRPVLTMPPSGVHSPQTPPPSLMSRRSGVPSIRRAGW
jgi:hypothetical protein